MLLQAYPFQNSVARLDMQPTINQRRPFTHSLLYPVVRAPQAITKKRHSTLNSSIKAKHIEAAALAVDYA